MHFALTRCVTHRKVMLMERFRDIIDLWPSRAAFADAIGAERVTARSWWQRDRIPSAWWSRVIDAASAGGKEGVTLELLASLAERRVTEKAA